MTEHEQRRWRTILDLLALDIPAPEIVLNPDDNEIDLDWWGEASLTITPSCTFAWAILDGGHGTDLDEFKKALLAYEFVPSDFSKIKTEHNAMGAAINETLKLADFLNDAAQGGAGFNEHWGERVLQAVEPLRNVKEFKDRTLEHNRSLLEHNGRLINERNVLREQVERLQVEREEMKRTYDAAVERLERRIAELGSGRER